MTEEFLHHCWKQRWYDWRGLKSTDGEAIEIVKPGEHNFDSGPDFFNAKIKLGATEWAGNVEIHLKTSDWNKHKHQDDKAYGNIILHVVYENDCELNFENGMRIPTLELKQAIAPKFFLNYISFKNSLDWIPCENSINRCDSLIKSSCLSRLAIERLEYKSKIILEALKLNHNNWEETFYQQLARNFGFKINAVPFELLAKSLPNALLAKHKNSILQVEALLFGNAGMLERQYADKYLLHLQNEYQFLKHKYKLKGIEAHLWKFLRLRPPNFPTIRITQFAALVHRSEHLFSKILVLKQLTEIYELMDVQASAYWCSHYLPEKKSKNRTKSLGKNAIHSILINTIVPFLFVYGKQKQQEEYVERAIDFLQKIPAENNATCNHFATLGFELKSAEQTQALIQMRQEYCLKKNCLHCAIGNNLLKNS